MGFELTGWLARLGNRESVGRGDYYTQGVALGWHEAAPSGRYIGACRALRV